jgi:hypothetical protein
LALERAGKSIEARIAMIAITTSSSMRVKASARLTVPARNVSAFMVALFIRYFKITLAQAVIAHQVEQVTLTAGKCGIPIFEPRRPFLSHYG